MSIPKRIFFISTLLLIATLLFWGAYYLSFKKPDEQLSSISEAVQEQKNTILEAVNSVTKDKIASVSEDAVLTPVYLDEEKVIKYFLKSTGRGYQIDTDGRNKKTFSTKALEGLSEIVWSPDKTRAIGKLSREGEVPKFFLYDYRNGLKETALKSNLDTVVWQNDDKIFYKYYEPVSKTRSLNISDPDSTNWEKLADLDYKNISISPVPGIGSVSFWNVPDTHEQTVFQSVSSVPLLGDDSQLIFTGKFGADYLWNKEGTQVLISHVDRKDGSKMDLAVINDQGGDYKSLEIPTMVSKAVWSRDNITAYYALPNLISENAVMPNDYLTGKITTTDTFWKVDTKTGKKSRVVELTDITSSFDASNLFLNHDESVLFFVNKTDGKLYRINLY